LELTVASAQATQYLADLIPSSGEFSSDTDAADLKLSGHAQLHALGDDGSPCGDETGDTEYDVGQHYKKLAGLAGIDDNSPYAKAQATLEIFGDQRKLQSITVSLGHPKQLDLDITGVLRLGFRWTFTGGDASTCHGGTLVLGDAQLVAAAGYVPPPSAEPSSSSSP
jgi:serine/threonine-protein kinase